MSSTDLNVAGNIVQHPNQWLMKLHELGPTVQKDSGMRHSRRVRGELSRQFQRFQERSEAEIKQFRTRLERSNLSGHGCPTEAQQPWYALLLQRQFCGPVVYFTAVALSDPARAAGRHSGRCILILSCAAAKALQDSTFEGTVVKLFHPWSLFAATAGRPPTVLCSERLAVVGQLRPDADIRTVLGQDEIPSPPSEILQGTDGQSPVSPSRLAICDFAPLARKPLVQPSPSKSGLSPAANVVSISSIDSWVSRVCIRARLIKACPGGLLLRATGPAAATTLPRWMRPLEETAAASPSSLWFADASDTACEVFISAELESDWAELLLGSDGGMFLLSDLTVRARTKPSIHEAIKDTGTGALRMSAYLLEATARSSFQRQSHEDEIPLPVKRPTALRRLLESDMVGFAASITIDRVTILARVARVSPPDTEASSGDSFPALELCVWDPSLLRAAAQTMLLRVAEPAQCLACAAVLAVGDTILVKDVCVERGLALGGIELTADRCTQICVCVDACDDGVGGQRSACAGAYGFCLPCVPVRDIDAFGDLHVYTREGGQDRWDVWPEIAPTLREAAAAGVGYGTLDALLCFRGAVVCIRSDPLPPAACSECGRRELRLVGCGEPAVDDEGVTEGDGRVPLYICSACEGVCRRPVRPAAAVRAGLSTGVEVLLAGSLLERAAAAASACCTGRGGGMGRRAGEGLRGLVGRELSGVAVRRRTRPLPRCDSDGGTGQWELRAVEAHVVA